MSVVFAGAMAVVLVLAGLFVYLRMSEVLDEAIDENLRARADDVAALIRRDDTSLALPPGTRLAEGEDTFAQVLTPAGELLDTTPGIEPTATVTPEELSSAARKPRILGERYVAGVEGKAKLLARPIDTPRRRLIVVVGVSTRDRTDALAGLTKAFAIGGPLALLLASAAGYALAATALRPVEAMRRRAERIRSAAPGERLPLPRADDEIQRLGTTLNEMLARLESTLERERTFVADASHELRTPLTILKTELELALRAGRSKEELREALVSASEETDRLAQLAEDLLVIARADQGKLPVTREDVKVADVLESARRRFHARAQAGGRRIVVDAPGDLRATLDALRVEQAVGNLLDNALRYGAGDVRIAARRVDGHLELAVSDAGPGFADGFAEHAFERFTRANGARSRGGAGLGLSIVRAIARGHGGDATADPPEEGRGARVTMTLAA